MLTQSVECQAFNLAVAGSNPAHGSKSSISKVVMRHSYEVKIRQFEPGMEHQAPIVKWLSRFPSKEESRVRFPVGAIRNYFHNTKTK